MQAEAVNRTKEDSETKAKRARKSHKWRNIRWSVLFFFNFLFFTSYFFDVQILEGTLSGSRLLGFHLIDPLVALEILAASNVVMVNLIIGVVTIVIIYLLFGGRSFCSWICPYYWLAEIGEKIRKKLRKKKIIKDHTFDPKIRYYFYIIFCGLAFLTGYTVFEVINPVAILSRAIVYGPSLMLIWVLALLLVEVFLSERAWCRYFCPVGVSYQAIGLLTPLRVKWEEKKCSRCKICKSVCLVPKVLDPCVEEARSNYVDSSLCTRCALCIDICPDKALSLSVKYLDKLI